MASTYQNQNGLSQVTIDAWHQFGAHAQSIRDRRMFYIHYLSDVVPFEISVVHAPSYHLPYDEIQLQWRGRIFMTGVVFPNGRDDQAVEAAAHQANHNWRQGWCVRDRSQAWGAFTATDYLSFYISRDGRECYNTGNYHPIHDARDVVGYLRLEYERISRQ